MNIEGKMNKSVAVWFLSAICLTSGFNLSRLMTIYIEACGEKDMCFDWPGTTKYEPHMTLARCPPCSCEDSCFQDLNCCPDKYFQRPLAILDTPQVHMEKISKLALKPVYAIIRTCPETTLEMEKRKCENVSADFDSNTPVSSFVSDLSYRNVFCAYCHGEIELNLVEWDLSIDLFSLNINFVNFIETYQQLRLLAITYKTNVLYSPPASMERTNRPIFLDPYMYFNHSCPDDKDLRVACSSSYLNQFRLHKNIFCYLCKLKGTKKNESRIDSCSSKSDETIQKCQQSSLSAVTYPYKNFYCFQCNNPLRTIESADSRNWHGSDFKGILRYHFSDFSTSVDELYISDRSKKKRFYLSFYNTTFSIDAIFKIIKYSNKSDIHFPFHTVEQNIDEDLFQLLSTIAAINPHRLCSRDLLSESVRNLTEERQCDCSYSCLFRGKCTCCIDTAFLHPVECVNQVFPFSRTQSKGGILVVSRCYKDNMELSSTNEHKKIKHLCEENPHDYNILISSRNITYRNIFCFLCNTNYTVNRQGLYHDPFKIVNFQIICEFQFRFIYLMNFSQLIQQAKSQRCDVLHDTSELVICDHKTSVSTWNCPRDEREGVAKWMCENSSSQAFMPFEIYKNEFCHMCNSNKIADVKACNGSKILDVNLKNACLTLPDVRNHHFVHPFRNHFCSHCERNTKLKNKTISTRPDCKPKYGNPREYFKKPLMRELYFPKTGINQQLFKRQIEKMDEVCYPGRILVGEECIPAIRHPQRITYALFILCQLNVMSTSNDTNILLRLAGKYVGKSLSLRFSMTNKVHFSEYFFLPIAPIVSTFREGYFQFTMEANLYFELTYLKSFDRDKVERYLLDLPANLSVNFKAQEDISLDLKGIKLSNISKYFNSPGNILPEVYDLFVARKYVIMHDLNPVSKVYVSNLLLCRQRMFNKSEVESDSKSGHITLKTTKETFYVGDYVLDLNYRYRVCIQPNQPYIKSTQHEYTKTLETFTTVLNIISIVSLLILFVIYMKVPGLRTLPGLNVMSTTFSLFCMQVTYTAANVVQRWTWLCQVTGIILHYFWLSLCCCLFICSFHMFRTFSLNRYIGNNRGQNIRMTFTCYTIFCYFTPLLVIGTNVILTFGLEGNIGYGKHLCFVENLTQNIVTFVVPLTLTCTVNTVFFILTLLNIKLVKNIRKSKENTSELLISIKLFSLTGTVWLLQVLDSLLHISAFSFVVTFLTSSQGLFISLSFSNSSQILRYFKSLLGERNE